MKIDRDEAKRIADLAHLEFDDAGLERMAGEMTKILSYIDQLREVDVAGFDEGVPGRRPRFARTCHGRRSIARPWRRNAPAFSDDGHFIVPKVIGD